MKFLRTFSYLFVILFFNANTIIAQQMPTKLQSLHHVDALFIGAGYNYEQASASNFTLSAGLSAITSVYSFYISVNQNGSVVGLYPCFSLDPRWYTNVNRRVRKGKSVENNSANFLSLLVEYIPDSPIIGPIMRRETFAITPRWGFRSSFNQNFFTEFAIGLPYIMDDIRSEVGLHLGIKVGFGFCKK